ASLEQPLFNDWLRGWEVGQAAALKSTVRAQNTIKLNCAMNDSFFFIYFIADFFFFLRRSRFVVGVRENGLGARPNFLYAGKTLLMCVLAVAVKTCLKPYSDRISFTWGDGGNVII